MSRKRWVAKTEITPELINSREKRKWAIALRRYVLEQSPSPYYAPYFGLDVQNLRKWFEIQFTEDMNWANAGQEWQFEHLIPVTYFNFSDNEDLKLCWNFLNLRVETSQVKGEKGRRHDLLVAKSYFETLRAKTSDLTCRKLLDKIASIEKAEEVKTERVVLFIKENDAYLNQISSYSQFEFELLNSGRGIEEVKKELEFLKKFEK